MLRYVAALTLGLLLACQQASAQDWALKMFDATSHDFGTVAKGSKVEYRFQIKNIYKEEARILGVTSSCGCTSTRISKRELQSLETAEIVAEFNTRDFQGYRTATLTVTLECVSHAEVQLHVAGFIRRDVVLQPGAIDWGTVDLGNKVEKKLHVSYAGREDWRILDVKTSDPHFEVEISQPMRAPGRVSYDLLVRLTQDAPVGYVKDQLILVTNDSQARELPVDMEGRVVPDITINPKEWFIGAVRPGQKVTKNLLVRGKQPFKITQVDCPDKSFAIQPPKDAKAVHLIPVVFTAGETPGRITQKISIHTDQGSSAVHSCVAFAEVVKPQAGDVLGKSKAARPKDEDQPAEPTDDAKDEKPPETKAAPVEAEAAKPAPASGAKGKWTAAVRRKKTAKAAEQEPPVETKQP